MDDTADETTRPPAGPPKVLPRIQYKPPDPDPELDEEAEDETGEIALGEAPLTAKAANREPSPPRAGDRQWGASRPVGARSQVECRPR